MKKIEYKVYEVFRDKNSFYYYVIRRVIYDNWFLNWVYGSGWRYVLQNGEDAIGGCQYVSLYKEECEALINHLKKKEL